VTGFASAMMLAGVAVKLLPDSIVANATAPANAGGQINVNSNGTVTDSQGTNYKWLLNGVNSAFEIHATLQSSSGVSSQSGTYNAWTNLGTTQSWSFARAGTGEALAAVLLEIRPAGGTALASAVINFDLTVS
jgi:hypothetical protein